MGSIGSILADSSQVGLRYAERLVTGIPKERFARLAAPAGQTIVSNHPAFVFGHLCLYPAKVFKILELDPAPVQPPGEFEEIFSHKVACQDDPAGKIYPSQQQIMECFRDGYQRSLDVLRAASDELLVSTNTVPSPLKELCPTRGAVLNFLVNGHVTMHLGQVSAWRRMEGMPPA